MKRIIGIWLVCIFLFPMTAMAQDKEETATQQETTYETQLAAYDLSCFATEMGDSYGYLKELGLADFRPESITSLRLQDIITLLQNMAKEGMQMPWQATMGLLLYLLLSALFHSFRQGEGELNETYSTVTALVLSVALAGWLSPIISMACASIRVAADFIYAFVPVFCAISAAAGGLTTSFATHSLLLVLAQGLAFMAGTVFMPVINSFLALGICAGLRPSLQLEQLICGLKRMMISVISFTAGCFVSLISMKTAVAAKTDLLGIRSLRFVINAVVPVVGGALSEGLISIQGYSSLIKSSVGVIGMVAVALVFLPSLIGVLLWRGTLFVCAVVSDMFGDKSAAQVLRSFRDAMLLIYVVLIVSLLATVISIGVLVAARTV